jgi:predicted PhzF superfamily epimerase YddE/YHI9
MTKVHSLRVFTDANNRFGDIATVVIDEKQELSDKDRLTITRKLNTVETVFVNDIASADISIIHTQGETDFAGVAALGTAYLLSKLLNKPIESMINKAGNIAVSEDDGLIWVRASLSSTPEWQFKRLEDAKAIENINVEDTKDWKHTMVWAWVNENKGLVRARTFARDWGITEAQGNGSGSMLLATSLGRPIQIKHGDGSAIYAKPAPNGFADVGGRVLEESARAI